MRNAALIEMLLSFGVVLGLAIWDLLRTPKPPRTENNDKLVSGEARHPERQQHADPGRAKPPE